MTRRVLHDTYGEMEIRCVRDGGWRWAVAHYRTLCGWVLESGRIAEDPAEVTCRVCLRLRGSTALDDAWGAE